MNPHDHENKTDLNQSTSATSDKSKTAPGQATAGTDRAEVASDEAHQAHHTGGSDSTSTAKQVQPSEETKNQDATSKQSRALSGTTAPSKV